MQFFKVYLKKKKKTTLEPFLLLQDTGEFDWDSETQEFILAGFFYGYIFTQLPGGWLADKFGGKYIFALGVLSTSLCSLVFPVASYAGPGVVFATRVVSGFGEVNTII